jgi:hypothetical protein
MEGLPASLAITALAAAFQPAPTVRPNPRPTVHLETLARGRGQTLSDLIRSALDSLPVRGDETRLDVTPPSLTPVEHQQTAPLHRVLTRSDTTALVNALICVAEEAAFEVFVDEADRLVDDNDVDGDKAYQLKRAEVLEIASTNQKWPSPHSPERDSTLDPWLIHIMMRLHIIMCLCAATRSWRLGGCDISLIEAPPIPSNATTNHLPTHGHPDGKEACR